MVEPYSLLEELKIEEELVGVYLSRHPLDNQKFLYELMRPTPIIEVQKAKDNIKRLDFKILGIVTADREFMGQNGNPYGKITLMDYSGSSEFWFFRNDFMKHKSFLSKDYVLIMHGSIEPDREGTRARTIYKKIMLATELVPEKVVRSVSVTLRPEELFNGKQQALLNVMTEYPGDSYLMFNFQDPDEDMGVTLVSENRITYSQEVKQILTEMSVEHHADLKIS
jgi:DNA polymerase-3 subunit alpha